jgi:hypothetical protein
LRWRSRAAGASRSQPLAAFPMRGRSAVFPLRNRSPRRHDPAPAHPAPPCHASKTDCLIASLEQGSRGIATPIISPTHTPTHTFISPAYPLSNPILRERILKDYRRAAGNRIALGANSPLIG